jgi:hypothetical protein
MHAKGDEQKNSRKEKKLKHNQKLGANINKNPQGKPCATIAKRTLGGRRGKMDGGGWLEV